MKKHIGAVCILCVLAVLTPLPATGVGAAEAPSETKALIITDSLGRQVSFDEAPERILLAGKAVLFTTNAAYLFPEAAELIIGTGSTDQGMGDMFPILDPGSEGKIRFANNVGPEQLVTARPDVIVLKSYLRMSLGSAVEKLQIPVLYVDLETEESFYNDIAMFGALMGNEKRADEIIAYYRERTDLVRLRTAGSSRPRVLLVSYTETDGGMAFNVPPAGWLQTRIIEDAGGDPVWKDDSLGSGWKKVNMEQVASWDPELVFVVSYRIPLSEVLPRLRSEMSLGMTNARILPFPADYYSWDQPDPRWILGLLWAARIIHPELFHDLDIDAEVIEFFGKLYGLDMSTIETSILPRLEQALIEAR